MGATPSHEDDGDDVEGTEDSDDDEDVIKMQHARYRVSWNVVFVLYFPCELAYIFATQFKGAQLEGEYDILKVFWFCCFVLWQNYMFHWKPYVIETLHDWGVF